MGAFEGAGLDLETRPSDLADDAHIGVAEFHGPVLARHVTSSEIVAISRNRINSHRTYLTPTSSSMRSASATIRRCPSHSAQGDATPLPIIL
jgi:hypothetical protein